MNRRQLMTKLRQILLRRRDALRRSLSGELRRFNAWEEPTVGDLADDALDTDYGAINSQLAQTESRELASIETALTMMQEGSYGKCDECGHDIPPARLQALPYATHCVNCQRTSESRERSTPTMDWSRLPNSDSSEDLRLDSCEFIS
jgi:DnaK suppressor protein